MKSRKFWALLTLIPLAHLVMVVTLYRFDAPWWDEWELLPLLVKAENGQLSFADFWQQHNEHRIPVAKAVLVAIARATHWNMNYEVAAACVLGVLTWIGLLKIGAVAYAFLGTHVNLENMGQTRASKTRLGSVPIFKTVVVNLMHIRTPRKLGTVPSRPFGTRLGQSLIFSADTYLSLIPLTAVLFFSMSQWNNWLWGWHILIFLTSAAMVWSIVLLSKPNASWLRFLLAALLCIVATFTFGGGVAAWMASGFMVLAMPMQSTRKKAARIIIWLLLIALTGAAYLYDYHSTSATHSLMPLFAHPIAFVQYVFAFLGSPLASFSPALAAAFGFIGVILAITLGWVLVRKCNLPLAAVAPCIALQILAATAAFLTAVDRAPEGPAQALSSRYITWPTFLWIALATELYWFLSFAKEKKRAGFFVRQALYAIAILAIINSAWGTYRADERHDAFLLGRNALISGENEENLRFLYPNPERVLENRAILIQYQLNVFHYLNSIKQGQSPFILR